MDPEIVEVVQGIIYKIWQLRQGIKKHPEKKELYERRIARLRAAADEFRGELTLYKEYSSLENLAILGEKFFYDMKRNLPALTFATSILGLRLGITLDGFYSGLRPVNLYTAPNLSHLDSLQYDFQKLEKVDCRMDADLDPELPLSLP